MRRISVIGSGTCSGKTTFGRALAAKLRVPFIEQDALFWGPNWTAMPRDDFRARVLKALEGDAWVVDGNYGSIRGAQWERADTLIWLDVPYLTTVARVVIRTLRRIRRREVLWSGNRETIVNSLLRRDSLLWYAIRTYGRRKRRFEELMRSGAWAHLTVLRFRSNAEADRWLASLP